GGADLRFVADQDGDGDPFVDQFFGRPEDLFVVPFGEDDPLGIALGFVDDVPGDLFGAPLVGFEVFDIFGHVLDGLAGNATVHGGLGNGRGDVEQDAG